MNGGRSITSNVSELPSTSKELNDPEPKLIKVSLVTYSNAISILCRFLKQDLILGRNISEPV